MAEKHGVGVGGVNTGGCGGCRGEWFITIDFVRLERVGAVGMLRGRKIPAGANCVPFMAVLVSEGKPGRKFGFRAF